MAEWVTIERGDTVVRLADAKGFFQDTIWNHANNAELKSQRTDSNVLAPGDRLYIPDLTPKTVAAVTDRQHVYRRKGIPAILRIGGAAIVNTLVVGALAGLHALLVVSLFAPGSGVDLWLALLVTGVVTLVLWAVARPFRRLVSMVSLTREEFGGVVPGAGSGPMSRVWDRMRGGPPEDRQTRWWDERRGAAAGASFPDGGRPEAQPGARVRELLQAAQHHRERFGTRGGRLRRATGV